MALSSHVGRFKAFLVQARMPSLYGRIMNILVMDPHYWWLLQPEHFDSWLDKPGYLRAEQSK